MSKEISQLKSKLKEAETELSKEKSENLNLNTINKKQEE